MTKYFKSLQKSKKVAAPVPRTMEEIQKDYSELIGKVGQAQYQVFAYQREVDSLNNQLLNVNLEAKARNELDAKAKADAPKEAANE